jgi:SAM-dependent methyltransferase
MKGLISFITRKIPRHIIQRVAHVVMAIISPFYRGNRFEDPIDGHTYRRFLPYGQLNVRANALAPMTMSLERHRLIWLYLKQETNFFTSPLRFLHVAPEYCFLRLFKKMKNLDYVTGDLISPWADIKMDVRQIPLPDDSFDAAMCNHVFEHVVEDLQAMKEFYRILKPGGWAIFQVPIDTSREKTLEDPAITSEADREKHYWQRDHVRLYGLDYGKRLAEAGFIVEENSFIKKIGIDKMQRYALDKNEILFVCHKPK